MKDKLEHYAIEHLLPSLNSREKKLCFYDENPCDQDYYCLTKGRTVGPDNLHATNSKEICPRSLPPELKKALFIE